MGKATIFLCCAFSHVLLFYIRLDQIVWCDKIFWFNVSIKYTGLNVRQGPKNFPINWFKLTKISLMVTRTRHIIVSYSYSIMNMHTVTRHHIRLTSNILNMILGLCIECKFCIALYCNISKCIVMCIKIILIRLS